jgi:hypothetical protein
LIASDPVFAMVRFQFVPEPVIVAVPLPTCCVADANETIASAATAASTATVSQRRLIILVPPKNRGPLAGVSLAPIAAKVKVILDGPVFEWCKACIWPETVRVPSTGPCLVA